MNQTLNNFIQTNSILKITDQKFSSELIFEEVLQDSDLNRITLVNCDFQNTDLYYCDFINCNFNQGLWRKCNFYDCTFENCKLFKCEWSRVDFYSSQFMNCDFQDLNLKWSKLINCKLIETNWNRIRLESIGFHEIQIQKTTFTNLDFSQIYPTSIGKLKESIQVKDSKTFQEAIRKLE